jgi:tRNA pseudouridine55 synthase
MNGFLNIHKEAGWTSHDVVAKVRNLLTARHLALPVTGRSASGGVGALEERSPHGPPQMKPPKVGHAGTLDPQATGVLPICLGKATKLAEFLLHTDKEYRVVMKLGVATDTQDAQGQVLMRAETRGMTLKLVEKALKSFIGRVQQIPPMYSAIKVKGEPLYKMARRGQVVDRSSREVTIYALKILEMHEAEVTFDVVCSRGTYIRTLCADVGEQLGVGAHCSKLQRRRCGPFQIEEAVTLEELESALVEGKHHQMVYSLAVVLGHLPELIVRSERVEKAFHGTPLGYQDILWPKATFKKGDLFRVVTPDIGLMALARALMGSLDLRVNRTGDPLFKIEKVLVENALPKVKSCNYTTV